MKPLKILYWSKDKTGLGAAHFINRGWRHGISSAGHFFYDLTLEHDDWERRVDEVQPDILFLPNLADLPKRAAELMRIRQKGVCVFLVVNNELPVEDLNIIRDNEIADIYFGNNEPDYMEQFVNTTGRPYVTIPLAADRLLHFPTPPVRKYQYDFVFLGNRRTNKSGVFEECLFPLMQNKKYKVGVFGPFWTKQDYLLGAAQKALSETGLTWASNMIMKQRISVPFEEENALYSSAKICLNFHQRESITGPLTEHLLNERAFKIPACGGFQLCDAIGVMPKYFKEDEEIVIAHNPEEFREKAEYYINNDAERERIRHNGTVRALKEHTYHNRLDLVLELYRKSCSANFAGGR